MKQLVSEVIEKKEFAELFMSTLLASMAEGVLKGKLVALKPLVSILVTILKFTESNVGRFFKKHPVLKLMLENARSK